VFVIRNGVRDNGKSVAGRYFTTAAILSRIAGQIRGIFFGVAPIFGSGPFSFPLQFI
jgi:hypothetical protein